MKENRKMFLRRIEDRLKSERTNKGARKRGEERRGEERKGHVKKDVERRRREVPREREKKKKKRTNRLCSPADGLVPQPKTLFEDSVAGICISRMVPAQLGCFCATCRC